MGAHEGIINLHKPVGISSAEAVHRVRAITGQRKSGHAGAIDPGASGVLLVCLGRATKLVERIMDLPKTYRTTARLDVTSESFDSDRPLTVVEAEHIPTLDEVRSAFAGFVGVIEQVPPQISAVKIGGIPAYKRFARGRGVVLSARLVRIDGIVVHGYEWPLVEFEVRCGRGTYIRSLIRDVGQCLGTGGCLSSLKRTSVGPFSLETAWTLEAMQAAEGLDYCVSVEQALAKMAEFGRAAPAGHPT